MGVVAGHPARFLRLTLALLALVFLGGCAAGVTALVVWLVGDDSGGKSTVIFTPSSSPPLVSGVEPRESGVLGGFEVRITGFNFDANTLVSVALKDSPSVRLDPAGFLLAEVPFNDRDLIDVGDFDLDPGAWSNRYTDSAVPVLRLQVTGPDGIARIPFWYKRPRLRSSFDIDAGNNRIEAYGHLAESTFAYLRGDYFGFANARANTRVHVIRLDGGAEVPIAAVGPPIPPPGDPTALAAPAIWFEDPDCDVDCEGGRHQGRALRVRLPTRNDVADASSFLPGPNYLLRVINEAGRDDVEFGFAPPFPPVNFLCEVKTAAEVEDCTSFRRDGIEDSRPVVLLSWDQNLEQNGRAFDGVFVERWDPVIREWRRLEFVVGDETCFVDSAVQHANYAYRIYGLLGPGGDVPPQFDFDGRTPAVHCEAAVIPPGRIDVIWDLGDPAAVPASGDTLRELLRVNGRASFQVRPLRNTESFGPDVQALFEDSQRVRTVWVTTGRSARFGALDEASVNALVQYLDGNPDVGLYLEGQHAASALVSSAQLVEFFRETYEFDPLEELVGSDEFASVRYELRPQLSSLSWNGGTGGIAVYKADEVEVRGLQIVLEGDTIERDGEKIVRDTGVAAILAEETADPGESGSRGIVSFVDIAGFALENSRRELMRRLLGLLDPSFRPLQIESVLPNAAPWDQSLPIEIIGLALSEVTAVRFGTRRVPIDRVVDLGPGDAEANRTALLVHSPVVEKPAVVDLFLELPTGDLSPVGEFTFTGRVPRVDRVDPECGTKAGGQVVEFIGEDFTSLDDTTVTFSWADPRPGFPRIERRAEILALDLDDAGDRLLVTTPSLPRVVDTAVDVVGTVELRTSGGAASTQFTHTDRPDVGEGRPCVTPPGPGPVYVSISPSSGPEDGVPVAITVRRLTSDTVASICGQPLLNPVIDLENGRISGDAPPGMGACAVSVQNRFGVDTSAVGAFTYDPPSSVTFAPAESPETGGIEIVVTSDNLTSESEVTICGNELTDVIRVPEPGDPRRVREIRGIVPPGCGSCTVRVTNPASGNSAERDGFNYRPPLVTSITPREGPIEGGFEVTLTGRFLSTRSDATLCGKAIENLRLEEDPDGTQRLVGTAPRGDRAGPCEIRVANGCDPEIIPAGDNAFGYFKDVLFLGQFSFSLSDTERDPERVDPEGTVRLRDFMATRNLRVDIADDLPGGVTGDVLARYDVVVFSVMAPRDLAAAERQALADYVQNGGGLVLLGQHGIVGGLNSKDTKSVEDRNGILEAMGAGLRFRANLLSDPELHWQFDGCAALLSCLEVGSDSDSPQGDPDNGVEYPVFRPEGEGHPALRGVEAVIFRWGQGLEAVAGIEATPILRTSDQAWADLDPVFDPGDEACTSPWFVNSRDAAESAPAGGLVAAAAIEHGSGRVIALGDQDMFQNDFFKHCFRPSGDATPTLLSHDRFVRNVLEWVSGDE